MSQQVSHRWKHLDIRRRVLPIRDYISLCQDVFENGIDDGAQENRCHFSQDDLQLVNLSRYGSLEEVKMAMEDVVDVNNKSQNGDTPLFAACDAGRLEIVQYLLLRNASVVSRDALQQTVLHRVRVCDNLHDVVTNLLEAGADIDADDSDIGTPLHLVSASMQTPKAKCLISLGAKLNLTNINGATALHLACSSGAMEIVRHLLDAGANVKFRTDTWLAPLHVACYNGFLDIARVLVEHGALVAGSASDLGTHDGISPLHIACIQDNVDILDFLLGTCEVNISDANGATPLHYACRYLSLRVTKHLLNRGASVCAVDTNGHNALSYLLRNGIRCGRHVTVSKAYKFLAWHERCHDKMVTMLRYLLEAGLPLPSVGDNVSCYAPSADVANNIVYLDDSEYYDEYIADESFRCKFDDLALIQRHPVLIKWLMKAGASLESLCSKKVDENHEAEGDDDSIFFEDYIFVSDGVELSIISAWCRWRIDAGQPMNGTLIADMLSKRLVDSADSASALFVNLDGLAVEGKEDELLHYQKCCEAVKHDVEVLRYQARTPHTLTHIVRIKIRAHLVSISNNRSIFSLINALPLAMITKDLLKLSDLDPFSDDDDVIIIANS